MTKLKIFSLNALFIFYLFETNLLQANLKADQFEAFIKDNAFINEEPIIGKSLKNYEVLPETSQALITSLCARLKKQFRKYRWKVDPCGDVTWKVNYKTSNGNPLIYAEFGNGGKATTLFIGGVHPDEITPIHLAFKLARHLKKNEKKLKLENYRVVVAPLANPDAFFKRRPLRTNLEGIDPNRNFPTDDWYSGAHKAWGKRGYRARYFPGAYPETCIETVFQQVLIREQKPDKIVSIHAPLGFLDYDGPGDQKPNQLSMEERRAKQLVHSISKKTENYRIVDYSFFPGSLGNYAGKQNGIPTVTLELKTTDPRHVNTYWKRFEPGLIHSILYPFKTTASAEESKSDEM